MRMLAFIVALLLTSVASAQSQSNPTTNSLGNVGFYNNVDQVGVIRNEYGSGTPGSFGYERAIPVENGGDILHAPQYMPFYPTAGSIWPRVVEVPCTKSGDVLKCEGYQWQPKLGRGEYLFIKPVVVEAPKSVVITKEVPVIILKEVPVKKKRE